MDTLINIAIVWLILGLAMLTALCIVQPDSRDEFYGFLADLLYLLGESIDGFMSLVKACFMLIMGVVTWICLPVIVVITYIINRRRRRQQSRVPEAVDEPADHAITKSD